MYDPITHSRLGQVFVYLIPSLLNQDFTQFATLTGPVIDNLGGGYGASLAIDKDVLAIGAFSSSKLQSLKLLHLHRLNRHTHDLLNINFIPNI